MPALGSSRVDITKALSMKALGASYADLSKMFNTTPQNVSQTISRYYPDVDIQRFCEFRKAPDIYLEMELFRLVSKFDDPIRVKMLERRGYTDAGILFDKIRLLRGQSTSISEHVPVTVINILQARLASTASQRPTEKSQVIDITDDNK